MKPFELESKERPVKKETDPFFTGFLIFFSSFLLMRIHVLLFLLKRMRLREVDESPTIDLESSPFLLVNSVINATKEKPFETLMF